MSRTLSLGASILIVSSLMGPASVLGQERGQQEIAQQQVENAKLYKELADLHVERIRTLAKTGQHEALRQEVQAYREALGSANERMQQAAVLGADVEMALHEVDRATSHHGQVLAGLLEQVPEEAHPALQHAMEVSQRGRQTALYTLQSLRDGSRPTPQSQYPPAGPQGTSAASVAQDKSKGRSGEWRRLELPKEEEPSSGPWSGWQMGGYGRGRDSGGPPVGVGPSMGLGGSGPGSAGGPMGGGGPPAGIGRR